MNGLKKEVRFLKGVGERRARSLQRLGIYTIEDLIFYFPRTYRDFSKIIKIGQAKIGQKIAIKAKIQKIKNIHTRRRRFTITEALVSDETGTLKVLWFNQPYLVDSIKPGEDMLLAGPLDLDKKLVLKHPEYEIIKADQELKHLGRIVPVYHESAFVNSRWIRRIIKPLLDNLEIEDYLPEKIRASKKFPSLKYALKKIHFPDSEKNLELTKKRLAFDEVFVSQAASVLAKEALRKEKSYSIKIDLNTIKKLRDSLPFALTGSQKKAIWQIIKDIGKNTPMNRLLGGDVGSGKTIVAAFILLVVAKSGYQGVLMVPTEILAWEHFSNIKKFLKYFKVNIEILTGSTKLKDKKIISERIKNGQTEVLIGTHALIEEKLKFKNLALAVIDEQHRFGVKQRKALKEKNKKFSPHFLSMTATPIPRTSTLTVYGDLDISVLKEMPKGERKVKTFLVPQEKRLKAYIFIKDHIKKGEQAFVICPTILKSDKLGVKAAEEEYEKLSKSIFKGFRMDLLHGKVKSSKKQKIMNEFKKGRIKILICTSVVEVGIDISNLTIMMIENADRFGLAQLHQLRGRIGRAGQEAFFLLFTNSKNPETLERLKALTKIKDGFKLAEFDLSLRGPGEIFGTEQSGYLEFKLASFTDYDLIVQAKKAAEKIILSDPDLNNYPLLKEKVKEIKKVIHLE